MNTQTNKRRREATHSLLSEIRVTAKQLTDMSSFTYPQALDHLARIAGYVDWSECLRVAEGDGGAVQTIPINPRFTEQFLKTPFWDRPEADLIEWFERPFVREMEDTWQVSAYDGRDWVSPSHYGSCTVDEGLHVALDLARHMFYQYWSTSDWRVEPFHNGGWAVMLRWQIPFCNGVTEVGNLYIASSKEQAHRRNQLLREIREQRMSELGHLF